MTLSRARFSLSLDAISAWTVKAPAITFAQTAVEALAATRPHYAIRPVQNFGVVVDCRQAGPGL
jgi:hypothetical protein